MQSFQIYYPTDAVSQPSIYPKGRKLEKIRRAYANNRRKQTKRDIERRGNRLILALPTPKRHAKKPERFV